ncbi:PREDICTED: R3H and coiled-coil domain-containing protein 1 isoform X2 [Poecilia mexicana]|uniref:R3H and coiled-coil domain-containing protein 1 isoform X2 n=1 Tax=Poecilia mexicana TaxID=48701 RepID=UPI00072E2F1B|nr:PREDICTED: R3H and coiled-coil domain-containing protein 1 isoform X2 [Poecilia mexicana]XP_016528061.1 PREDICTED: R3H and coiled-coil domain-containing protein 1 isoform X2 [Poecilia formosa]
MRKKSDRGSSYLSVLLFPPLPSRLRYLIHRTIEDIPDLTTFSVGESWCRRVVVCPSELRAESEEDSDVETSNCLSEEHPGSRVVKEPDVKVTPSAPSQSRTPKRPDQPLYLPRAVRKRLSLQDSQGSAANKDIISSAQCCRSSLSESCSCPKATEQKVCSASSAQEACAADGVTGVPESGSQLCPQEQTQKSALGLDESEAVIWDQSLSFAEMRLEEAEGENLNNVQAEDASTDTDDVTEQIKMHLKETGVSVELVHNDYAIYENVFLNSDDFSHVIEIYDFPSVFKTDDLLDAFTEYSDGGMKIKWVDNTHALGVFSCQAAAHHALSICHPLLKTRALSEGSKKAQGKAVRRAEFLQPVKERPRTDCAVAKRMVTRALGIPGGRLYRYEAEP